MRYASSINDPTITIGYATHAGRTGKNNEDDYVVFETELATDGIPPQLIQVAAVADGIGGNIAGETASHLAAENFYKTFKDLTTSPPRRRLVEAIEAANLAIYDRAISDINLQGMGTTVVAAALMGNELFVAHAGDSRAYLIRGGRAHRLTLDHTWAQEAIEAGRLTPERAKDHPNRHVIKRFLGIAPEVEVDTVLIDYVGAPANPDQLHETSKADVLRLQAGDTILLCSDGLTDVVTDKQIEQTLKKHNLQDAANELIDLANKGGGPDNITVVIMHRRDPNAPAAELSSPAGGRSSMMGILLAALLVIVAIAAAYMFGVFPGGAGDSATPEAATAIAAVTSEPIPLSETPAPSPTDASAAGVVVAVETATQAATETAAEVPTETETPDATSTPVSDTAAGQGSTLEQVDTIAQNGAISITDALSGTDPLDSTAISDTTTLSTASDSASNENISGDGKPPTSTPLPEFTDTPAPTDTPTIASTRTPTVTSTRTPRPIVTATATVAGQQQSSTSPNSFPGVPGNLAAISVQIISPGNNDTIEGKRTFAWQFAGTLPEGYAFEPAFWKENQNPVVDGRGWGGSIRENKMEIDLTKHPEAFGMGRWGVRLVRQSPYQPIRMVSEERRFVVQLPNSLPGAGTGGEGAPPDAPTSKPEPPTEVPRSSP